jgi:hypothetical protein
VAAANQRTRDVRATNCSPSGLFHDSVDIDVDAQPAKPLDDILSAHFARVAKICELSLEHFRL